MLVNQPKVEGERATAVTKARSSHYTAVYLRYRTATSSELQESVALVDASQDMAAVFRFVIDASRPPTAGLGDKGTGTIDPAQEGRRRRVRQMALQRFEEYRVRVSEGQGAHGPSPCPVRPHPAQSHSQPTPHPTPGQSDTHNPPPISALNPERRLWCGITVDGVRRGGPRPRP
jgi:hypothetical protein